MNPVDVDSSGRAGVDPADPSGAHTHAACPSKVADCPHKAATLVEKAKERPATVKDLDEVRKRLEKLEPKVKP